MDDDHYDDMDEESDGIDENNDYEDSVSNADLNAHSDTAVIFDHGGSAAVLGQSSHMVSFWNSSTGEMQLELSFSKSIKFIAGASHGRSFALSLADNTVYLWDTSISQEPCVFKSACFRIVSMVFKTRLVISGSNVELWNVQTRECVLSTHGSHGCISSVEPLIMAYDYFSKSFNIWGSSDSCTGHIPQGNAGTHTLALSSDGARAVAVTTRESVYSCKRRLRLYQQVAGCVLRSSRQSRRIRDASATLHSHRT